MSFFARFGAGMCNRGLRLLNGSASRLVQPIAAHNYHIMADCRVQNLSCAVTPLLATAPLAAPVSGFQRLLTPFTSLLTQVAGFKVKGRLKRRCKDCYFVIRQQRAYVICPTHPRHKQMAMKKRDYKTWILTHATQSKQRPY